LSINGAAAALPAMAMSSIAINLLLIRTRHAPLNLSGQQYMPRIAEHAARGDFSAHHCFDSSLLMRVQPPLKA
jgi:hypothetical protein